MTIRRRPAWLETSHYARPAAEYGRAEGRLVVLGGFAQRAEVEREQVVASGLTPIRIAAPNRLAPVSAVGILQPPSQSPPHPSAVFVEARTPSRIQKVTTPMTSFALTPRIAGLILAVCVITTFSSHAFAQGTNPLIGTWTLNIAKSNFSPGPPRKSETRTYAQNGDGLKVVIDGVNADGSAYHWRWAAHFDGKDYPMVGNPGADMITITMTDASTLDATFKKGGKVTGTRRFTVSKDGKTMTTWQGGTNNAGLPLSNFTVWTKQ